MNLRVKSLFESVAAYFVLLQILSVIYLYFFWMMLGVDFFDYVVIQDVIFSSGEFSIFFTTFAIFCVLFLHNFELMKSKELLSLKWYLLFFSLSMAICTIASLYLPYEYKNVWWCLLFIHTIAIHYIASSLAVKLVEGAFFQSRFFSYASSFLIISGLSFSIVVPVWESLRIHESNEDKIRYVKVKDCDECYHWLIGRLGDFSFVTLRDKSRVVAIPNGNIENITHHSYKK